MGYRRANRTWNRQIRSSDSPSIDTRSTYLYLISLILLDRSQRLVPVRRTIIREIRYHRSIASSDTTLRSARVRSPLHTRPPFAFHPAVYDICKYVNRQKAAATRYYRTSGARVALRNKATLEHKVRSSCIGIG